MDSFALVRLLVIMEVLANARFAPDLPRSLDTLGEVYGFVLERASASTERS